MEYPTFKMKFNIISLSELVDELVKADGGITPEAILVHLAQVEQVSYPEFCYWSSHTSEILSMTSWASIKNSVVASPAK